MNLLELVIVCILGLFAIDAFADCKEDQWDIWKSAKARQQGLSKETVLMHIDASQAELTPERIQRIKGLVDEVYALEQGAAEAWWKERYRICPGESEA